MDRLRQELRNIESRDYFDTKEKDRARRAIERLAALLDAGKEAAR